MSDARALLRAQRTARRITHPHANYSSAGTLLCVLCREAIKTESFWDSHVSSSSHQKRLAEQKQKQQQQQQESSQEQEKQDGGQQQQKTMEVVTSQKRKHDGGDEEMADAGTDMNGDMRRKRSRGDISVPGDKDDDKDVTRTPPTLPRRPSQTPSQGVELQIPSRPATPRDTHNISSSSSTASAKAVPGPPIPQPKTDEKKSVDEDEWAAFEADIAAASTTYDDATISAPAMTAEESARAREAEEDGDPRRKKSKPEVDLAEEKEEAQRALEEEFDEMRELQERVTQLKQRRESLRQRAQSQTQTDGERARLKEGLGKENEKGSAVAVVDEEEESSDDEDDEDDWDSFRFRR